MDHRLKLLHLGREVEINGVVGFFFEQLLEALLLLLLFLDEPS